MIRKLRHTNGEASLLFNDGSHIPVRINEVEHRFMEPVTFTGCVLDYMSQGIHTGVKLVDPFDIKDVIFNDPATIVLWADGAKTVVKCQEDDVYSPEVGLALCFAKKALGNKGNFNNVFKKWIPEVQSDCVYCGTVEMTQVLRSSAADALAKLAEKLRRPITPGEI